MEDYHFSIDGRVQDVHINPAEIHGTHDGRRSVLNIPVSFKWRLPEDSSSFEVISGNGRLMLSPNTEIASDLQHITMTVNKPEVISKSYYSFLLTAEDLYFIESRRKGDMFLTIEFQFLVQRKSTTVVKTVQRQVRSTTRMESYKIKVHTRKPRSTWVERILTDLNHQNFMLIEIPLHYMQLAEAYSGIIKEFKEADKYFRIPDYNKCVAHCRSTLDKIHRNVKKIKDNLPSEQGFLWLQSLDKATFTWIDELDKQTSRVTSPAHHAVDHKEYTRAEAESIYLVTLGLLHYMGNFRRS